MFVFMELNASTFSRLFIFATDCLLLQRFYRFLGSPAWQNKAFYYSGRNVKCEYKSCTTLLTESQTGCWGVRM